MKDEVGNVGIDLEQNVTRVVGDDGRMADNDVNVNSHKKQVGWKVATGVLAVLAVVLGGLLVWQMVAKGGVGECKDVALGNADVTVSGDTENSDGMDEVLLKQDAQVRETVAAVGVKAEELLEPFRILEYVYDVEVPYKPEGFLTAIQLNRGYGFKIERVDNPTLPEKINGVDWASAFGDVLEGRGFVNTGEYYTSSSAPSANGALYVSNESGVVCEVENAPRMNCSHKDWYDKADAELSNELSKIFEEATGEKVDYLVARVEHIRDSAVAPYQTIEVGRRGYGSSFYRVNPEAEWVYFASGQDGPACAQYNTEDLRKAFAGRQCWADGGYMEVEP